MEVTVPLPRDQERYGEVTVPLSHDQEKDRGWCLGSSGEGLRQFSKSCNNNSIVENYFPSVQRGSAPLERASKATACSVLDPVPQTRMRGKGESHSMHSTKVNHQVGEEAKAPAGTKTFPFLQVRPDLKKGRRPPVAPEPQPLSATIPGLVTIQGSRLNLLHI